MRTLLFLALSALPVLAFAQAGPAGKVDGQQFTFTEVGSCMEMPLRFAYVCELTSADEATCTRTLEGFEGEALVMKRSK